MRENTIAQDYDGFQHGEPWRDDWADQRAIERCEAAREAHLAAGFGDGAWRDDIVAKVRSFEDGSVEFNGYRRSVTNRLQDLRDRPRRARGAKPETEEDKEARSTSAKAAAKRAKQNVRLRCKAARVTHMLS